MKTLKIMSAALFAVVLSSGAAFAFHDAGVADCAGCHTMHNSQDGMPVDPDNSDNPYLLVAASATDACLTCHAGYGQFAGGLGYGPGGDFYWVTKTWSWSAHGHDFASTGDSHGHNVVSPTYGIDVDATLTEAPGGDFLSSRLGCTSCHDPHGNQSFRILYGSGLPLGSPNGPVYNGGTYPFTEPAPLAKGNSRRTIKDGSGEETDAQHTVYKSGMSEWCANCHNDIHSGNTGNSVHPTGQNLGSGVAAAYNGYQNTDAPVGGDVATSYWGLVPFEAVNVDLTTVDSSNFTQGPTGNDQVACISCHRAHASAFADIARWDMGETFIIESRPRSVADGATVDDLANMYYDYEFVDNQRSLCNKCHVKDANDGEF